MEKQELLRDLIEPIYRAKFWMQLIGVMLIIGGILSALSIVGIIVAWVPIWAGVVLMQAAKAADKVFQSGDEREMKFALSKIKTYFTIFGVMTLLYILFFVGMLLFGAASFGTLMSSY
ncbi:DUF5362 family protein [Vreelandella aquamarina]|uniref:DUF5362 family protein n=1 Tax=Vreelandella aquamarina TaxID=77097 RepID=UPI001CC6B4BC|nr:DUF5362 family protein [Halomonas aquamarina]